MPRQPSECIIITEHHPTPRDYPLLIGCGEHDIPMELTIVELWNQTEANASVAILPGAGHCANMDVPDLFNRTLHQFFTNGSL